MQGKIKILYCIDSVGKNAGTERQLVEIIRRINKDRFEVHLCCVQDSPRLHELEGHAKILFLPVDNVFSLHGLRQAAKLRRYIRDNNIDIVQTFMLKARLFAVIGAMRSGRRALIASRRDLGYWINTKYRLLLRLDNCFTSNFLTNSEAARKAMAKAEMISEKKIDVIYNGVDTQVYTPDTRDHSFAKKLGIPDDAKVVGIVANYRPVKDLALFIRAAKLVADKAPNTAFLLVGEGELYDSLRKQAQDLGIADKVFFTQGNAEVADCLSRMSIGCLTSESEGFSNAILEYMAAGLPVVASAVGGNPEAIIDGETGWVINSREPEEYALRIVQLLADDNLRAAMGQRSLDRCRALFDINISVKKHEEYYEKLAGASK